MPATTPTKSGPPRFFLRRAGAFIIDSLIYSVLFTFLVGALGFLVPSLQPALGTSFLNSRTCSSTDVPDIAGEIESLWPDTSGDGLKAQRCIVDSVFMAKKYFVVVTESRKVDEQSSETRSVSIQTDANGTPIFPSTLATRLTSLLDIAILPLYFAAATGLFGWTPGKRALSLIVTRQPYEKAPASIGFYVSAMREYLKFWPICVFAVIQFILSGATPEIHSVAEGVALLETMGAPSRALGLSLLSGSATLLVLFVWWVFPMALWRGRMYHDAICGSFVVLRN
ncbi:RDD family protein [Martelella sp. HB161492]|uniref:RDD family protein n=1 Tax=Martelella sp. HB161492 TaxID=2720726 RepID=UPI00159097F7|nr:RDD family protein [Martelella sp. HB161492]